MDYQIKSQVRQNNNLFQRKFLEFLPIMTISNLSTLFLLVTDDVVVANLVGEEGLSAVNILNPFVQFVTVIVSIIAVGTSITDTKYMGSLDEDSLGKSKRASRLLMTVSFFIIAVVQIPIAFILMRFLNPSANVAILTWHYTIGIMISLPVGLLTTVNTYELQLIGKMKFLFFLSVLEGVSNIIFDLLFVGVFHMDTAGAGYGTAVAVILRAIVGLTYVYTKTDLHKNEKKGCNEQVKEIISSGFPAGMESLALALLGVFMNKTILYYYNENGIALMSVLLGIKTFGLLMVNGIIASLHPLINIAKKAINVKYMRQLLRSAFITNAILVGIFVILCDVFPSLFFDLYGKIEDNASGQFALIIYIPVTLILGFIKIIRLYLSTEDSSKITSTITLVFESIVPVGIAFLIASTTDSEWVWSSYSIGYFLELLVLIYMYHRYVNKKEKNAPIDELVLSLSPQNATKASESAENYLLSHNVNISHANFVAICIEEMSANAKLHHHKKLSFATDRPVEISIIIGIYPSYVQLTIVDDGEYVGLNEKKDIPHLITDSYDLVLKIADEINYEYILNLNLTKIKISLQN